MRPLPPPGERGLPLLAGVLLALAYPPAAFLLPSFVGLAPLLVFIEERSHGLAGRFAAIRGGLLTGVIYFGLQLYWIVVALIRQSPLAIPAFLLTVLVLAALTGAFAGAVHFTRERLRLPLPVLAAVFWTALEWLQAHLGDLSFPWLGLGTSLAPFPRLAGAADLVGARGLTFWLAAANGMVAVLVLRLRARRAIRTLALATAAVVAIPAGYGFVRAATLELHPVARVAIVQPNIPEDVKLDPAIAIDSSLAALNALTTGLTGAEASVDLIAWPEVALPADLAGNSLLRDTVLSLSRYVGAPILAGAYARTADVGSDTPRRLMANSAFLLRPSGIPGRRYDKRRLVPFVERVPFVDPAWLQPVTGELRYFGGLTSGDVAPVFRSGAARFGVLICYESAFASLARGYRDAGADFLVNTTNDAWYGREPWYARTTALWQHPAHLVLRAIETRMGIARAANTGISMFVDPLGRTYGRIPLFEADVRVATVYTTSSTPIAVRLGDWLATLAMIAAILLLGLAFRHPSAVP